MQADMKLGTDLSFSSWVSGCHFVFVL